MTRQISLSEQLGAMALVDDLRHRDMVVQQHLDLPERRAEVMKRVREYYAARQIEVDEATIEQGVTAYFDRRLTFEAPAVTPMQARLAHLYITRSHWAGKAVAIAVALSLAAAGIAIF